jgi:hypothetical protein
LDAPLISANWYCGANGQAAIDRKDCPDDNGRHELAGSAGAEKA